MSDGDTSLPVETSEASLKGASFSEELKTEKPVVFAPEDRLGLYYVGKLLEAIQERSTEAAVFVAVIGYIFIAAFGEMDSLRKFLRYIIFLSGSFYFYSFASHRLKNQQTEKKSPKKSLKNIIYISLIVLLLAFIIWENFEIIANIVKWIPNTLHSASGSKQ